MRSVLQQVAEQVISGTAGQVIDKAGYVSVGTGAGLGISAKVATEAASMSYMEMFMNMPVTTIAAYCSAIGALSFAVKNLFEIWWKIREGKKNGSPNE